MFAETTDGIRVIGFRKANAREVKRYAKAKAADDAKGEVREVTASDLKAFRPARKALPESLRRKAECVGHRSSAPKERITIRAVAQCCSELSCHW